MRSKVSIIVVLAVGLWSLDSAGRQRDVRPVELKGISQRLYEIVGGRGAQGGVYIGDNGVLVIDAKQDKASVDKVIAEIGNMSERRIALLMDDKLSGLPPFLVNESGLNSGFMITQVTAAALASENKQMAHPASLDSIPTSANQEDHVSMATHAARRLSEMADNAAGIVAIELLAAAQGIDFHKPLKTSKQLTTIHLEIRKFASFVEEDRPPAPDIEAVKKLVDGPLFTAMVADLLPGGRG